MPISAGQSLLQTQIKNALSLEAGAQIATTASTLAAAVAGVVPMGFFPVAPTPTPLAPGGLSAGQSLFQTALSLGPGASIATTAQMFATAVSLIAPTAPPAGLSSLQSQIESSLNMGEGANIDSIAAQISTAIVQYYVSGGVQ